jgi:hypothetical protein
MTGPTLKWRNLKIPGSHRRMRSYCIFVLYTTKPLNSLQQYPFSRRLQSVEAVQLPQPKWRAAERLVTAMYKTCSHEVMMFL